MKNNRMSDNIYSSGELNEADLRKKILMNEEIIDKDVRGTSKDKSDIRLNYFAYLLKKYIESQGIKYSEEEFDKGAFVEWLLNYMDITSNYAVFLKTYDVDLNEGLAEIGKGKFDTIVSSSCLSISKFNPTMGRKKLVFGNIYKGLLIYNDNSIMSLDDLGIDMLITQNTNYLGVVDDFKLLSNVLNKNTVFGVYGNFDDKDSNAKIKMIKTLLHELDDTQFFYDTDKDNYYMAVMRKPKIKGPKIKTL